mgnify:CR=1 FL=1
MAADTSYDADVLIVGAGPAGLALACALSDAGISCLLVEQQGRELLDQPQEDGREIALTHRARRVMQQLGLWAHLDEDADVALLNEARVIDGSSPQVLHFGADALSQNQRQEAEQRRHHRLPPCGSGPIPPGM